MELVQFIINVRDKTQALQKIARGAKRVDVAFQGVRRSSLEMVASIEKWQYAADALQPLIDKTAALSDLMGDVRKTTGMSQEEVSSFADSLKGLDTRTGLGDLMEIGAIGGQLGVAKNELFGFTESVDQAVVALGKDFGGGAEVVASKLGKLKTIFKDTKDMEIGQAINKIGSAINHLGSQGANTAPEVAEFATRLSALGDMAPNISQALGMGAAFEEFGLSAEIASGGLKNILTTAATNTDKFAKLMGITRAEFEGLLNNNPNEMLLQLASRLQGAKPTELAQALHHLGIRSQEAQAVMGQMSANLEIVELRQHQAAEAYAKGTSLTEEFNVKNNTLAGTLAKMKNRMDNMVTGFGGMISGALPAIQTMSTLGTTAAQLAPLTSGLSGLGNTFKGLVPKIMSFNVSLLASPIVWIPAAIVAAGVALYFLYNRFDGVRRVMDGLFEAGKVYFSAMMDWLQGMALGVQNVVSGLWDIYTGIYEGILNPLQDVAVQVFGWLSSIDLSFSAMVAAMGNAWTGFATWFTGTIDQVDQWFKDRFGGLYEFVKKWVIVPIGNVFSGLWKGLFEGFQKVLGWMAEKSKWLADKLGMDTAKILGGFDKVIQGGSGIGQSYVGLGEQLADGFQKGYDKSTEKGAQGQQGGGIAAFVAGNRATGFQMPLGGDKSASKGLKDGLDDISAGGRRQTNINVNVGTMVDGGINLSVDNLKEGSDQMRDMLMNALADLLNSANRLQLG